MRLLILLFISFSVNPAIERPAVLTWDLTAGFYIDYDISIQCNSRPETIYKSIKPAIGVFNIPQHEIGNCTYKVASSGSTARSKWSNEVKELIVLEAPTSTIE